MMRWRLSTASLARVAISGTLAFVTIVLLLHVIEREYSPSHRMVSEYALGDFGLLLNAAGLLLAIGSIALAWGLLQAIRPPPLVAVLLLATWSIGAAVAGVFNTDAEGVKETTTNGAIHTVAVGVAVLALIAGTTLFGRRFQRDPEWSPIAAATHWWAMAMVATTVATMVVWETEFGGFVQRIWLCVLVSWLVFAAIHLRKVASDFRHPR
jgi:Protein of unknown function (DUF998)